VPARVFHKSDWQRRDGWNGVWNGEAGDTGGSFIFSEISEPGLGPKLHTHAYDEVQIVRRGRARFRVGDEDVPCDEGDIIVIPAGTPHLVRTVGGETDIISVHLSGRIAADWLE